MKKFLIGILTVLMTLSFIVLGINLKLEGIITENIEEIIKEEITNEFIDQVAKNKDINKEKLEKELTEVLEKNDAIKKTLNQSIDMVLDILSDKEIKEFDLTNELEEVIKSSEEVLKEYGITLKEAEKENILKLASSEEVKNIMNDSIKEIKEKTPTEVKTFVNVFNFIRSAKLTIILITTIALSILFIALLKKSYYKWLANASESMLISGILFGVLMPLLVNVINKELEGSNSFVISTNTVTTYGFILIGFGLLTMVLNIVLSKQFNKKEISKN